jgi:ribosomal protein S18 acetylase RimI-like enzyme
MTRASTPSDLEARLEKRGYRTDSLTCVQLLDLTHEKYKVTGNIELTSKDSEAWHEAFARMNNVSADRRATHENILRAILPEKCYVSLKVDGHLIGCGLGVLQAGYLGIFDIVIDSHHRGQGHGTRLMQALLAWGQDRGANKTYLQVMCNNGPALKLYGKLGFQEQYQYWYRIKT